MAGGLGLFLVVQAHRLWRYPGPRTGIPRKSSVSCPLPPPDFRLSHYHNLPVQHRAASCGGGSWLHQAARRHYGEEERMISRRVFMSMTAAAIAGPKLAAAQAPAPAPGPV